MGKDHNTKNLETAWKSAEKETRWNFRRTIYDSYKPYIPTIPRNYHKDCKRLAYEFIDPIKDGTIVTK